MFTLRNVMNVSNLLCRAYICGYLQAAHWVSDRFLAHFAHRYDIYNLPTSCSALLQCTSARFFIGGSIGPNLSDSFLYFILRVYPRFHLATMECSWFTPIGVWRTNCSAACLSIRTVTFLATLAFFLAC